MELGFTYFKIHVLVALVIVLNALRMAAQNVDQDIMLRHPLSVLLNVLSLVPHAPLQIQILAFLVWQDIHTTKIQTNAKK